METDFLRWFSGSEDGFGEEGYDHNVEPLNAGVLERLDRMVASQPWSGVATNTSNHQPLPERQHDNEQSDSQMDLEFYWTQLKNPMGDTLSRRLNDVDFVLLNGIMTEYQT